MASGALWLQFRSLILQIYRTPAEKQAENQHDVSTHVSMTHPVCLSPCLTLILTKEDKHHQQAFMSHHKSAVHTSISWRQRISSSKDSPHQLGFKEHHIRDPFCIRSVPLNHSSDVPHSGTLLSALIHALLPCPMEVIRCAPFLLDHRATGSWYYKCLICNPFCGSAGDARNLLCRSYQNKAD